jgi:hypothetical protein
MGIWRETYGDNGEEEIETGSDAAAIVGTVGGAECQ